MRGRSAALTAVVGTAALTLAWRVGSPASSSGTLAGVHVVTPAAPADPGTAGSVTTPAPGATSHHSPSTGSSHTTAAAPTTRRVTGAVVSTPYGDVQVRAVVRGRRLLDVVAVHLTDANGTSRQISAYAAPVLRQEALQAGSARIDTVSGATYTSEGYRASLQAALDAALR